MRGNIGLAALLVVCTLLLFFKGVPLYRQEQEKKQTGPNAHAYLRIWLASIRNSVLKRT